MGAFGFVFLLLLFTGMLKEGTLVLEAFAEKLNGGALALSVELPAVPLAGGRGGPGSACPVAA